jgi:hypothetical protein
MKFLHRHSNLLMRRYHLLFFLTLILNTGYLILAPKACAQTLSLSLWPPLLEVMMRPGKMITQVYKLTNNSDHELQITPRIFPFEPEGETGEIKISFSPVEATLATPYFSFASREKFGQSFLLPVGETREMVLKISLPQNNPEKDYYYTLLFSSGEEALASLAGEEGKSTTVAQIGTNILLTASQLGKPTLLGRITLFSAPIMVDSFSAANFSVILENWGKSFWKPFGKIEVSGPFDQKGEIPLREQNVLANSSRRLTVDSFRPPWPIGPFKAKLTFSLNEDGPELSSQISFWYLPYKLTGTIVTLLILLLFGRRLKNRFSPQRLPQR